MTRVQIPLFHALFLKKERVWETELGISLAEEDFFGRRKRIFFSPPGVHQLPPSSFSSSHDGNLPPVTLPLLSFLPLFLPLFPVAVKQTFTRSEWGRGDRKGEEKKNLNFDAGGRL